jgi:hypothetical protein
MKMISPDNTANVGAQTRILISQLVVFGGFFSVSAAGELNIGSHIAMVDFYLEWDNYLLFR